VKTGKFVFRVLVGAGRLEREACLAAEASGEGRLLRDHLDDQPDEKYSIFLD
jgi:hypothetical protein